MRIGSLIIQVAYIWGCEKKRKKRTEQTPAQSGLSRGELKYSKGARVKTSKPLEKRVVIGQQRSKYSRFYCKESGAESDTDLFPADF